MWNNYSKEKTYTGYNLGFDINDIMCDIYKKQYNAICGCIIYDEKKQKSIIKSILKHWNKKYERTLRATRYTKLAKQNRLNDILLELIDMLSLVSVFFKNNKFKRALKSINIGPTMNENIFYTSTNRMLLNFGYDKVEVNWSKIPLRY